MIAGVYSVKSHTIPRLTGRSFIGGYTATIILMNNVGVFEVLFMLTGSSGKGFVVAIGQWTPSELL